MRYLNISRFTEPTTLRLLDGAYIVVMLPLLLVIKMPMLLYMLVLFFMLLLQKEVTNRLLALTALGGMVALFFSMYGAFSFSGLSRLKIFIELLIYLLIIATTLQRLTRKINIYLYLSPLLLLALSLFFFQSIGMLIYVVFEIFILLWLAFAHRMQGSWRENLRMAGMLYALSLPWVVILFIVFPRISFEHASYGFRQDILHTTGHDGKMYLDNKAELVLSDRIVMEVSFKDGAIPPSNQLYFRGTVLYNNRKDHWEPLPQMVRKVKKKYLTKADDFISYKVVLYPTKQRWLYMLDMPLKVPRGARMDADFVTRVTKPIIEPLYYEGTSALDFSYGKSMESVVKKAALRYPLHSNQKSLQFSKQTRESNRSDIEKVDAIVRLFRREKLTYTLQPSPLDLNNSVDSFLFEKKRGYCVHFASSFVLLARMAGIPARVVTGYKAKLDNSIENYIVVKERDAHAWAELFVGGRWTRYETTAYASTMEESDSQIVQNSSKRAEKGVFDQINLYLMYVKYQIEAWILEYSHFRQLQLLEELKQNPTAIYKVIILLLLLGLLSYGLFRYFHRTICDDLLLCLLAPLIKRLQSEGYGREERETMHQFLMRVAQVHTLSSELLEIDQQYEQIRYAGDESSERMDILRKSIKSFLRGSSSK